MYNPYFPMFTFALFSVSVIIKSYRWGVVQLLCAATVGEEMGSSPLLVIASRDWEHEVTAEKSLGDPGSALGEKEAPPFLTRRWDNKAASEVFMLLSSCLALVCEACVLGSPIPVA